MHALEAKLSKIGSCCASTVVGVKRGCSIVAVVVRVSQERGSQTAMAKRYRQLALHLIRQLGACHKDERDSEHSVLCSTTTLATTCDCHSFVTVLWVLRNIQITGLTDLFIQKAHNNIVQGEQLTRCHIEVNDNRIVQGGKSHGESEDLVLVANFNSRLFHAKREALDMTNPGLH
jgi:hypothetical protein